MAYKEPVKGTLLSYRNDIKVLDATVRDGGLVNNFFFTCLLYTSPSPRD